MVGVSLVNQLLEENAKVRVVSIDDVNPFDEKVEYLKKILEFMTTVLMFAKIWILYFILLELKALRQ